MGKFFKTSSVNKHSHIAYITNESLGYTSMDHGHQHPIVFIPDQPEQPPVQDQAGNVVRPGIPARKGGFTIMPSETDGHGHELENYVFKKKKDDNDNEEMSVRKIRALFKAAKAYEQDFRDRSQESMDFYNNKQWTNEEIEKAKAKKRSYETINEINHKVKLLSGYQRQNRTDIRYVPVESGDQVTADILNNVVKNICEQNNFSHIETLVFEDGVITGRGFYQVYIDNDKNVEGDVIIKKYTWNDVYIGPHDEYTLDDCEYLVKTKWYSKAKVRQMFPDKVDEIKVEWDAIEELAKNNAAGSPQTKGYSLTDSEGNVNSDNFNYSPDFYDISKKNLLVMELEEKKYVKLDLLINTDDESFFDKKIFDDGMIEKIKSIPGFKEIKRTVTEYWVYKSSGGTLLDKYESDLNGFSIVPYYIEKRGDNVYGKVETVKGEQRIVNKAASQTMDIINKTATYGWFIDANTFPDEKFKKQFLQQATSAGFIQEVNSVSNIPVQVQGVKFPNELVNVQAMHSEKLRELMNVNNELLGLNSQATSGIAIVEKKRQGLIGNEYIFDNLSLAKRLLGRLLVQAVQLVYSPKRIYRILRSSNARKSIKINKEPFDSYTEDQILNLLGNLDISKFDVVVSEAEHSPTMKESNFVVFSSLMQSGLPVPPNIIYELSNLPEDLKLQAIQFIQQQQEMAAMEAKAKRDSETTKSEIGAKGKEAVARIQAMTKLQSQTQGSQNKTNT